MSQQGRTNPVVWDIARAIYLIKGDCYFVIHAFFPIILAPTLWFGEKRDGQPRSTSGDFSSPPTLRLSHLSLYLCCITSSNKPSIQPSDPTWQVALISTSRITTTTEKYTTQSLTNSLEISWWVTFCTCAMILSLNPLKEHFLTVVFFILLISAITVLWVLPK